MSPDGLQTGSPWPKWHGTPGNTGLGVAAAPNNLLKWVLQIGVNGSAVIGDDGTVYVGSADKNVYALDPSTGATKWTFNTGNTNSPSPALGANGTLYIDADNGYFYALDGATGAELWMFNCGTQNATPSIGADGTVYIFSVTAPGGGGLDALDPTTGAVKWSCPISGSMGDKWSAIGPDGTLYVAAEKLYAINPSTGAQIWAFTPNLWFLTAPVVGSNGTVYASSDGVYAIDTATGAQKWMVSEDSVFFSSPAIGPDGTLYVGTDFNGIQAFDGNTGILKWGFNPAPSNTAVLSSPAVASDGTVYCGFQDGNLYAIDPSSGTPEWSYPVVNGLDPVIGADGTIYIGNDASQGANGTQFYAIGIAPQITNFYTSPASVVGGESTTGVVQLSIAAGSKGTVVELAGSSASISMPASVTVPAGAKGVSFKITTAAGAVGEQTITSSVANSTVHANLALAANFVSGFYASPTTQIAGGTSEGVVQLAGPAPSGGLVIALSSGSTYAAVPATATIAAGKTGTSFPITTSASGIGNVTLKATLNSASRTSVLSLTPGLTAFYPSASTLIGGSVIRGVVQLGADAGSEGAAVSLKSALSSVSLPASVTIPASTRGLSFAISSSPVSSVQSAILTAIYGPDTLTMKLTINPYPLSNFYLSSSSITGGAGIRGVVQLSGKAGSSGNVVSLSSPSGKVIVPATVTVPAGTTGVSFAISTKAVTATTTVTITASSGGISKQTTVTLTP